jgi:RNA ligase
MDTLVTVTRKEDGSLGIGWKYNGQYGIATRGSFTSDQAKHATAKIDAEVRQWIDWTEDTNSSVIYEIVYPENRIVLDYKGRDELIRLGNVDNRLGVIGHRGDVMHFLITLEEALKLKIPADEEGYVLDVHKDWYIGEGRNKEHHIQTLGHIKLKGEDYKILHGLLTNTSARRIWVQLAARACHHWIERDQDWASRLKNDPEDFKRVDVTKDIVDTFLTNVPDEFYDWVTRQIDSMNDKVSDLVIQSILLAGQLSMVDDKRTRFEAVKDHPMCMEILRYVESRDESNLIIKAWALAKPTGEDTPFKTQTEED